MADCVNNGIAHRIFHEGMVQSLRIANIDGQGHDGTIGIIQPGTWDFGNVPKGEIIKITSGRVKINGMEYYPEPEYDTCEIESGELLVYKAEAIATYLCIFV